MLTLAALAREIERALPCIDIGELLPRKRRYVLAVPLATLLASVVWFSCSGLASWKKFVRLLLPLHLSRYPLSYCRWCFWRVELANLVGALAAHFCIKQAYRDHKYPRRYASKGCGSLGWFYGFKLHLVT